ncbi:MAG: tripartite tricarboxylate transporter substrate-binding protein [Beijerinckiaceae bacterium]|nr:tripartite tricarboxylate transporter substrate-binding protein [Beijerinckiaceae bacterium]
MGLRGALRASVLAVVMAVTTPAYADEGVAAFYKGRSVDLIVGYGTGGGYDTYARALAPHLAKHLPGAPQIVIRNMPGASSLNALRHIATTAPRDGGAIGAFNPVLITMAALEPAKVKLDFGALTWIGNMSSDTKTCMLRAGAGLTRLEDFKTRKASIGATSQGSGQIYGVILRHIFGDNVQIVTGYPSTNDIALAMERGEVDGMCTGWGVIEVTKPDWIKRDFMRVLTQFAAQRDKRIASVPLIHEAALPSGMSAAITFLTLSDVVTRPIVAPPLVPAARAEALRRAFDAAMADADFLAFAKKTGLDIDPTTGEDLARIVQSIFATPPHALEFARKLYN